MLCFPILLFTGYVLYIFTHQNYISNQLVFVNNSTFVSAPTVSAREEDWDIVSDHYNKHIRNFILYIFQVNVLINFFKVDPLTRAGDLRGAKNCSRNAKQWSMRGIVTGSILILIAIAIIVVRVITANNER